MTLQASPITRPRHSGRRYDEKQEAIVSDLPIACTWLAPELQRSRMRMLDRTFARVEEIQPLEDGYSQRFPPIDLVLAGLKHLTVFNSSVNAALFGGSG